jgi:hypothetical protein
VSSMEGKSPPQVERDGSGRISSVEASGREISGPLGIWPYPILNALFGSSESKVEITEINRTEDGRIESIEEIRL